MMKQFKMFMQDEDGASAVEYGLLVSLIAAAIILTVQGLGDTLEDVFDDVEEVISLTIPAAT